MHSTVEALAACSARQRCRMSAQNRDYSVVTHNVALRAAADLFIADKPASISAFTEVGPTPWCP